MAYWRRMPAVLSLMRGSPSMTGLLPLVLGLTFLQAPSGELFRPKLTAQAFRRAFEEAFDAEDTERVEQLVRDNPTQFAPLFEIYANIWIDREGAPSSREERVLGCARAIAEAADAALEAP